MSKTLQTLLATRPWIAHIDDERDLEHGIIVTLVDGWDFVADPGCGVYGFDTVAEVKAGTKKSCVQPHKAATTSASNMQPTPFVWPFSWS